MRCRHRDFAFSAHVSAYEYSGTAQAALRAFKFNSRWRLVDRFCADLAASLPSAWRRLPVVASPARRTGNAHRDYDPVLMLARRMAALHQTKLLPLLKRRGGTSQKELGFEQRLRNLSGCISISRSAVRERPLHFSVPAVLLVDDVFTTGATAHECASVLAAAGIATVYVATLAMEF